MAEKQRNTVLLRSPTGLIIGRGAAISMDPLNQASAPITKIVIGTNNITRNVPPPSSWLSHRSEPVPRPLALLHVIPPYGRSVEE